MTCLPEGKDWPRWKVACRSTEESKVSRPTLTTACNNSAMSSVTSHIDYLRAMQQCTSSVTSHLGATSSVTSHIDHCDHCMQCNSARHTYVTSHIDYCMQCNSAHHTYVTSHIDCLRAPQQCMHITSECLRLRKSPRGRASSSGTPPTALPSPAPETDDSPSPVLHAAVEKLHLYQTTATTRIYP